ncbi:methyltransferase domain-containing protein [Petroclostridium sp. X23]|uniref:class I SAM-dependent methyltransferase n=1 Tax=Petroclostridium sp. X23 TaxID=3045146 RepID=UPI0024ADDBEF|nr:methyltransferase domain-containing protein [Petroclostridium sp. X23]WHH60154.1 methyltransferase domain-containing protein [Petroclostridium sp. X23]
MDVLTEKIRKRYDRVSGIYDFMEKLMDSGKMKQWREEIIQELSGKILEVGVGTGKNIEYYPHDSNITAIDFSSKMLDKAREKAGKLSKKVELIQMDAQNMDFEDNTFDAVFTSCVFCSVPDPVRGLREIRRVCKNNGKIVMLEHVRSDKEILGLLMDIFNPLVVGTYGANINRRTVDNILKAGFSKIQVTDLMLDIVKKITVINTKLNEKNNI